MLKHYLFFIFITSNIVSLSGQVSKTNNSPGLVTNGSGHITRTFTYNSSDFSSCSGLTDVSLELKLNIGGGTTCSNGTNYGVHEDLNVRLNLLSVQLLILYKIGGVIGLGILPN